VRYLKESYYSITNKLKLILPQEFHAKFSMFSSQLKIDKYLVDTQLRTGLLPILIILIIN
jgi:hypothetical protein